MTQQPSACKASPFVWVGQQPSTSDVGPWLYAFTPSTTRAYGPWAGKWLLHLPAFLVDDLWREVAEATSAGRLGSQAKVAIKWNTTLQGKYVVCVYTADCRDLEDVARVRPRCASSATAACCATW